ncbi:holo-ACP synthase, partial [Chloroflexota bacterium]
LRLLKTMNHVGVDLVEINRIERAVSRWGEHFLRRVFTCSEIELCKGRIQSLAARMAAKEAAMKALGTGLCEVGWCDIEILADDEGRPIINLWGGARTRAFSLGLRNWAISLAHSREHAIAYVHAS